MHPLACGLIGNTLYIHSDFITQQKLLGHCLSKKKSHSFFAQATYRIYNACNDYLCSSRVMLRKQLASYSNLLNTKNSLYSLSYIRKSTSSTK